MIRLSSCFVALLTGCASLPERAELGDDLDLEIQAGAFMAEQDMADAYAEEKSKAKALEEPEPGEQCLDNTLGNKITLNFPNPVEYPFRIVMVMDKVRVSLMCQGMENGEGYDASDALEVFHKKRWVRTRIALLGVACGTGSVSVPLLKPESHTAWSDFTPRKYHVLVMDKQGNRVIQERFQTRYRVTEPNGKGCGKAYEAVYKLTRFAGESAAGERKVQPKAPRTAQKSQLSKQ